MLGVNFNNKILPLITISTTRFNGGCLFVILKLDVIKLIIFFNVGLITKTVPEYRHLERCLKKYDSKTKTCVPTGAITMDFTFEN